MKKQKGYSKENNVVVCIPYYKSQQYIRRAVESILVQTHKDLTVVVVNDGDFETSPWPVLSDIVDPRLVRFDLPKNRGPYFATQVVLEATTAPYILIQDSDDWSHSERLTRLLTVLKHDGSDFATSAHPQVVELPDRSLKILQVRWEKKKQSESKATCINNKLRFQIDTEITPEFQYRSPHHGLFKTESLRNVGGYYGGFIISYDVLLTNLILMTGKLSHTSEPLYCRFLRRDSLTHSNETGIGSSTALNVWLQIKELYKRCYGYYSAFKNNEITRSNFLQLIKTTCARYVTDEDKSLLIQESSRLDAMKAV